MVVIGLMLLVGVVVVGLGFALYLRSWTFEEGRREARLRDATSLLTYAVPAGQDPAVLTVALGQAGYESDARLDHGVERVFVACPESRRADVRRVIGSVHRTGFDGSAMPATDIRFDDET